MKFVAVNMPISSRATDFYPCSAIGVRKGDKLIAGFVYNIYNGVSIDVTVASVDPSWIKCRDVVHSLFAFPFLQLGVARLGFISAQGNKRAIKLGEGLGFRKEGVLRRGYDGVNDAYIYGMLREECKWLRG